MVGKLRDGRDSTEEKTELRKAVNHMYMYITPKKRIQTTPDNIADIDQSQATRAWTAGRHAPYFWESWVPTGLGHLPKAAQVAATYEEISMSEKKYR